MARDDGTQFWCFWGRALFEQAMNKGAAAETRSQIPAAALTPNPAPGAQQERSLAPGAGYD
jgi:hypothetical protein